MYAGWIATSGHSLSVDSMMTCDASQGSSWLLSVTTSTPSCPAPSLERANSCNSRMQVSGGALEDKGQVEKIFRSCSRADMSTSVWRPKKIEITVGKLQRC